ncbi:hypothetical protein BG015_008600 [Linnemannia schmuckeri]|uniref:N-acetylglucosaminylphosphatidylinositol deacetylase n=1 Tax=Linnemannia schmuckeri TaxID=64567 RepID=A0A9P5S9A8_9FUNG|nr:hypothetical protein BG015_008600 [Linnemannia schmuckeri]
MTPTYDTSTFAHPTRTATTAENTQTRSRGSSSRTAVRRQHYHFRLSLCTAAVLGLVLLAGHPSYYNSHTNGYYSGVYALPVTENSFLATVPTDALLAESQPYQQPQQQQQQILALHTSNSATFSAAPSATGIDGIIRLASPKHTPLAAVSSVDHSHVTFGTVDAPSTSGTSTHSGRVLASELTPDPQLSLSQDRATTTITRPKQDKQYLEFLDLMTRVSGKSRDQAEKEIWEERRATQAAVRKELEAALQLQRQQGRDRVAVEDDGRIELKQVSKLHAGSDSETKSKPKVKASDRDYQRKGEEAKEEGKSKQGKKNKQEKKKWSAKANSSGGNGGIGGGVKTTPTIFYVPHQDDDALAMALGIREHIEAGRRVIVHLYSDGINALLRDIVAGAAPCPLQHSPHKMELTLQDVVTGRTHEFRQSLRSLGVQDEDIFETGWSDIEPLKNYEEFQKKLRDLILGYERKYPGASHKCISGEYDRDSVGRNPTHRACWDVASQLLQEFPQGWPASRQLWDFRFYRTYTYYNPPSQRSAQFVRALPQFLPYKQRALDQYKRWEPSKGELAWGYHSVKALIDAAYNDPHVYLDMLDNDPTNPENWKKDNGRKGEMKGEERVKIVSMEAVEDEKDQGMFPAVWRFSREKSTNKVLLEKEQHWQSQDQKMNIDDELMGLHRKAPSAHNDVKISSITTVPHLDADKESETKWDEKEADMRVQVLKAFDDAAQSPEGKEYRNSIRVTTESGI